MTSRSDRDLVQSFILEVEPFPASRHRCTCQGGHPRAYKEAKYATWSRAVAKMLSSMDVRHHGSGPLRLTLTHVRKCPKRPSRAYPRGDFDNLSKAITDALTGIAWDDDDQIVECHISKRWADNGDEGHIHIVIEDLHASDPPRL